MTVRREYASIRAAGGRADMREGAGVMEERRKDNRSKMQSKLRLKRLDKTEAEVEIEVVDVSKTGVGFNCQEPLMIGAVYEAFLTIWTKEVLHAFREIVRIEKKDDLYPFCISHLFL